MRIFKLESACRRQALSLSPHNDYHSLQILFFEFFWGFYFLEVPKEIVKLFPELGACQIQRVLRSNKNHC